MESFDTLRAAMRLNGMTQKQLSLALGVSEFWVSLVLRGRRKPSRALAGLMAQIEKRLTSQARAKVARWGKS